MIKNDSIFLNDKNCIEFVAGETQDIPHIRNNTAMIAHLASRLRSMNQPVRILVNLEGVALSTDLQAALFAARSIGQLDHDRIAAFGSPGPMRTLLNFIAQISGRSATTKLFATRAEAEAWLLDL